LKLKVVSYLFLLLPVLLTACLQPDIPQPYTPEFEIRRTDNNQLLRVISLDPEETISVALYSDFNVSTTKQTRVTVLSSSPSIQVTRNNLDFEITGASGAMGFVTFEAADRTGKLRVFIRNWKKADVHRAVIYADMQTYDEDFAEPYDARGRTSYRLLRDNGFHYEAPDGLSARQTNLVTFDMTIHGDNFIETERRKLHRGVPHIVQTKDWEYLPPTTFSLHREVFKFIMHHELDGDMVGGFDDRQRLEVKTMDGQFDDPNMYSRGGSDTFTHRWKFRLPDDFRVSSEFSHIFQLKPEGGDSGNPTITLTGRRLRTGREVLQLIYRGPIRPNGDPSVNWYPAEVDLAPFKGEWIYAVNTVTYDNPGSFSIKLVRIRDMRVLMEYTYSPELYNERDPFMMFRPPNIYIRPKFGIYRRIYHMTPFGLPNLDDPVLTYLGEGRNERGEREMVVLYADFEMDKLIR
jgi:hypothetical protein